MTFQFEWFQIPIPISDKGMATYSDRDVCVWPVGSWNVFCCLHVKLGSRCHPNYIIQWKLIYLTKPAMFGAIPAEQIVIVTSPRFTGAYFRFRGWRHDATCPTSAKTIRRTTRIVFWRSIDSIWWSKILTNNTNKFLVEGNCFNTGLMRKILLAYLLRIVNMENFWCKTMTFWFCSNWASL